MKSLLAAITSRMPAVDCCPHADFDEDSDLLADTTHDDKQGSAANG